jgi:selenocysteine lyase/cysteine desulfurase
MLGAENPERLADELSRRGVLVDWRPGVVRISPHFFNTDEEVTQTLEILAELLG